MNDFIKIRLRKYSISLFVTGIFVAILAHGPCGGAAVGLLIGLFAGLLSSSIIWLLNSKWYWRIISGPIISLSTLLITVLVAKELQIGNEIVFAIVMSLIDFIVFITFIEGTNYLGRRITRRKIQNAEEINQHG